MTAPHRPAFHRAGAAAAGSAAAPSAAAFAAGTAALALSLLGLPAQAQPAGAQVPLAPDTAAGAGLGHELPEKAAAGLAALPSGNAPWQLAQASQSAQAPLLPPAGMEVAPRPSPGLHPPAEASTPAATTTTTTTPFNYAIGVAYATSPSYAGSDERKSRLRPVLALQYGRFRLSSSRGSSVLRHGLDTRGSGASATLVEGDRFNVSASLRIDNGRDASDATRLAGLPEVRTTLRGRVSMSYALTEHWSAAASASQDLLGRDGGAQFNTGLQYAVNLTPQTRFNMGVGASLGDATFMRSQFGVADAVQGPGQGSALAPFAPGAGLYSVDAGMGVMTALSRRWVAFGAVTVSQLRGDARRSPLTVKPGGYSATAGIAYRCCP